MKKVTTLVMLATLPFMAMAQSKSVANFQDKYVDNKDVTTVLIKGPLFKFIANFADYDDDPDSQAIGRIADGINSMEILQVPYYETGLNKQEVTNLRQGLDKDGYEELLMVRDDGEHINVLSQGKEDEIRNMLILVEEKDNFTLLNINGKLSMKDLSYLSKHHNNYH